jgi:hypothetical protein
MTEEKQRLQFPTLKEDEDIENYFSQLNSLVIVSR